MKLDRSLAILTAYAVAMALLEAAVVIYMRRLYYPEHPLDIFPLQFLNAYDNLLELSRELATVIMILAVALLFEQTLSTRSFAAFVFVFGVWDIFYYVWLRLLMGWPRDWMEWDVLFLIPTVWLGPWICPVMISVLFVVWGAWVLSSSQTILFTHRSLVVFLVGTALGLTAFLQPAVSVLSHGGSEALSQFTPTEFWWWLFLPGLLLMTCGLIMTVPMPISRHA